MNVEPEDACRGAHVCRLGLAVGIRRIDDQGELGRGRQQRVHDLQPLWAYLVGECGHAGQVTAGSAQAGNKSQRDRIGAGEKHNRNCIGRCLGGPRPGNPAERCDRCHLAAYEIGGQGRQSIILTLRPAVLDSQIAALDKAGFLQPIAKGFQFWGFIALVAGAQIADHRPLLLRPRSQRP